MVMLISLLAKHRIIATSINRLQHLIDRRGHAHRIYVDVERKHAYLAKWLAKIAIGCVVIVFFLDALPPISHAIFGYPPPQYWVLPVETQ